MLKNINLVLHEIS
jgi:mitotic-spindle organizing protein 1